MTDVDNQISNQPLTLADVLKEVDRLATDSADGIMAKPRLAKRAVQWASDGIIEPDDAKTIYDRFITMEGKKKKLSYSNNGNAAKTSELKQVIAMACISTIDPHKVLSTVDAILAEMHAAELPHESAYAAYVKVARVQLANKSSGQLDSQTIRDLCRKDPKQTSDIEKYITAYKTTLSTFEGSTDQPSVIAALLDSYRDAIEALGGEVPPTKDEAAKQRELAKAQAKAAKAQAELLSLMAA